MFERFTDRARRTIDGRGAAVIDIGGTGTMSVWRGEQKLLEET